MNVQEELKGQLAESLPNAVGIFADALYGDGTAGSGDKAKLFKEMELGKLGLEELTKVIDYMATLTKKDLLAQMLNTPAKKFTAMKNQWILMVEALNDGGVLDVMLRVFEEMTDVLSSMSKFVREHKEELKAFGSVVGNIWKFIKFTITSAAIIIGRAFDFISKIVTLVATIWKSAFGDGWLSSFLGAGVAALALTGILLKFPAILTTIGAVAKTVFSPFVGYTLLIVGAFLILEDIITGLLGGDSVMANAAKESGAVGTLAAILMTVVDTIASIGVAFAALVNGDFAIIGMVWDDFTDRFAANFPRLMSWFGKVGDWWSTFGNNLIDYFSLAFEVLKAAATLDFKSYDTLQGKLMAMSLVPTAQQLNPSMGVNNGSSIITNAPILNVTVNGSDPVGAQEIVTRALNESYMMIQQRETSNYQKDALNFPFVGG